MKTMKLILSAILLMVAFTVQAQTVQVYKNGAVVKEYPASEVKSVEVKQVYYYYVGWECPRNEEELARLAVEPNGGQFTSLTGLDNNKDYFPTELVNSSKTQWYLVIPTTLKAYDYTGGFLMTDDDVVMTKEKTIGNHTIWKSVASSKYVGGLKIY